MTGPEEDAQPGVSDFGISLRQAADVARGGHEEHAPDPRFALADEVRRVTRALVGLRVPDAEVAAATEQMRDLADRLEASAEPGRRPRAQPDPAGHPQDFFPTSPVIGFANPVAPPVHVEMSADGLQGTAFFDFQYEGPPTCVHGGVIALVFDELLGAANIAAGSPGMTGTLTIRYRKPTPLRTPLRLEARTTGRDGRKITTWGGIFLDDVLTAEAEGIFIELVPERFLQVISGAHPPREVLDQVRADAERLFRPPA